MPRPREIDEAGLFTYDFRHDSSKFWFLERAIRPVVQVGQEGRFVRPGMIQDQSIVHAGNVGSPDFPADADFDAGEVWVVDQFGVHNGSGAPLVLSGEIQYQGVGHSCDIDRTALDNLHHESFLPQPFYIDGFINTQVTGGTATEAVSVHARRVA